MSARRSVLKASAPPKNGGSRLEHVLSVGMSNVSINQAASVPATAEKLSFAMAHKAPIANVGISMLRKTLSVVPRADIGINWEQWKDDEVEVKVAKWITKIRDATLIYPNVDGTRFQAYRLVALVLRMGNSGEIASSESVNRGYYIYLLQVLEETLRAAKTQESTDNGFRKIWEDIITKVDPVTASLAESAITDQTISREHSQNIFAYFNFVNRRIYNFFTVGDIMGNPSLAEKTSPKLTKYLMHRANPDDDVREAGRILRTMRTAESPE